MPLSDSELYAREIGLGVPRHLHQCRDGTRLAISNDCESPSILRPQHSDQKLGFAASAVARFSPRAPLSSLVRETLKPAFDRILASTATQINHRSFCRDSEYVRSLIVCCTNSLLAIAASKTFLRNGMGRKYWFSFFASSGLKYVFCSSILFLGIFFVLCFGPSALCNLRVWASQFSISESVAGIDTVFVVPAMTKSMQAACTAGPVFSENRNLGVFFGFLLVLRVSSKTCHWASVGLKVTSYMSGCAFRRLRPVVPAHRDQCDAGACGHTDIRCRIYSS
jgi:hypothetical protein